MSTKVAQILPAVDSTAVFKENIFNGKVLFCTGGGSGICKGMTEAVMRHGANATIVGRNLDRLNASAEELSKATGKVCLAAQADVRKPEQLRDAVAKTIEKYGRIDFVICGAAGNFLAPISGLSENGFRTVLEIDTLGTYNTIKATMDHLRKSKVASKPNLVRLGTPYQVHVSAAKAALTIFISSPTVSNVVAVEEGPHGVRSNVIAPGPIAATEGMERLRPAFSGADKAIISAAGREGDIRDCANAAVFLLSDAACHITGQVLPVDGGNMHLATTQLPYPQSVLDPDSTKSIIKPRL
ncbi:hypothetical protein EIP91_009637 [Steccherinum ochraceum]|uniref:2,4-dienoyl-CoA reductase [(3E)-enoyl-CoA-producing] n=1 Tax=Steccherinum ochraceum TaxID=92696 RepID=A0A4R0R3P3_9APHY|nr:hypothetical protein EIP91_009637 [Steccherinum ochraceum]